MNIGQMLRSVIGEFQAAEGKLLELKAGQIVRGIVLQMLADQDALMNIGGVQVRAALETPLPLGQAALFQVQEKTDEGRIVLKPLSSSEEQIGEQTQTDVLRSFGLKDTEGNRQAVRELTNARLPVNKENIQMLADALSSKPETVPEGEWKEAALLAVKRGLPATGETVGALYRTQFGKPFDQNLAGLDKQLAGLLEQDSGGRSISSPTRELIVRIKQALESMPLPSGLGTQEIESGNQPGAAAQTERSSTKGELPSGPDGRNAPASGAEAQTAPEDPEVFRPVSSRTAEAKAEAKPVGVNSEGQTQLEGEMPLTEGAEKETAVRNRKVPVPAGEANLSPAGETIKEDSAKTGGVQSGTAAAREAAPQQETGSWIPRLLKALGVEHEQQFTRLSLKADSQAGTAGLSRQEDAESVKAAADTLKGMLIQLANLEDVPLSVRETAREAVQQITGQQLLLTPDRGSAFSHITLMLPLHHEGGGQTAAIHIQSKKGSRGELDAENCRLLFDLDMKTLGSTLVDVQVTDKIVGLRVHNDRPFLADLLEANRAEIAAGLGRIGYQFLSLKCLPYPEKLSDGADTTGKAAAAGPGPAAVPAGKYHANSYKGMDVRI